MKNYNLNNFLSGITDESEISPEAKNIGEVILKAGSEGEPYPEQAVNEQIQTMVPDDGSALHEMTAKMLAQHAALGHRKIEESQKEIKKG